MNKKNTYQGNKAKYLQIRDILKNEITNNVWKPGDVMPSEKKLMERFHVSQATIAHAMKELANKKMIARKPKLGTIVTSAKERTLGLKNISVYISGINIPTEEESLNWFVSEQIYKGIINNFQGKIYLLSSYELNDFIANTPTKTTTDKGIIFIGDTNSREFTEKPQLPCVSIVRISSYFMPTNTVNCNNIISAYNAISYLSGELAHRDIGFITGGKRYHKDYLAGYRMALDSHKIPYRKDYVFNTDGGGKQAGAKAGKQFIKLQKRPSAVYIDTDLKAIGFMEYLQKEKISVPETVSVIGSDDIPGLSDKIGLTTTHIPFYESGKAAIQMLTERIINNGANITSIPLYGHIVKRGTCKKFELV